MQRTSPTQWFTVSYNLTKISSKTIIPLYNTLPFWQSLALRGKRAHKGKEEATQSKVWTARDVFRENMLLCQSTPGGLSRPCCSWILGLGSGTDISNPHPDYKVQTLSKETLLVSSTLSHPSLSLVSCLPLGASPQRRGTAVQKARLPEELAVWAGQHCCSKIPACSVVFRWDFRC